METHLVKTETTPARRNPRFRAATAMALAAAFALGLAAPAHAAADPIAPQTDAWGRYYVDAWASNTTANTTPATNAAIGLLSPMLDFWTPEQPATPAFDANGTFLPGSVGTVTNHTALDANIAEAARITQTRTAEQAAAAYRTDRRNQNYTAIDGLGPYAQPFRAGSNAGTTIPDAIPADAATVLYNDVGNANGAWADSGTTYGPMVDLVNQFRNSAASTNPSKAFYNYARPFRWSDAVSVLPTLVPAKKPDADALSDGGYPSGHTNAGWLASYALAYAAPGRYQQVLTNASEIGNSRIVAGMHSPADVIGGRIMSTAVAAAALNNPANAALKQNALAAGRALLATRPTAIDPYADRGSNEALYSQRLTYGLPVVGATNLPVVVPKGAEALLESRLPYLSADQRRWVLQSTGLPSGHALLDDAEGWGRLDLFAAADGYSAFDTDVAVDMDAAAGGFSAVDVWRNDIGGPGSLTKMGTGTLTLAGANDYTGGTVVADGSLVAASPNAFGTGPVTVSGGRLSETSSGTVDVDGALAVATAGSLDLTVDSASPAFSVGGTLDLAGTTSITLATGFALPDDLVVATVTGSADVHGGTVAVQNLPAGYTPKLEVRGGAVHLVNTTPTVGTVNPGAPVIGGAAVAGRPLTVDPGSWTPAPVRLAYQWLRDGVPIAGATAATYTPGYADVARQLSVSITGTKNGYVSQSRVAAASAPVVAGIDVSDPSRAAGDRLVVSGAGFRPGEEVRVELRSTPVTLDTVTAAADGTFRSSVTIPRATVAGAHSIVAIGEASGISASAAISVAAAGVAAVGGSASAGSLAFTGSDLPPVLFAVALSLLALGAALVAMLTILRQRRRAG